MRRAILALLLVFAAALDGSKAAESPALSQTVGVAPLPTLPVVSLARHGNGEIFFDIEDTAPPVSDRAARPRRVRVYWDHSASRMDDDLAAERSLLQLYLDTVHPGIVDLVLFGGGAPELRIVEAPQEADQLTDILRGLRYDETAEFHDILDLALPPADACLYFSDGVLPVDPTDAERIRCPLFTVTSTDDANRGFLRVLARRGAGAHFDLTATSADDAVAGLTGRAPRVVGVASSDGRAIEYALLPTGADRFRIVGPLPKSGEIVVTFAGRSTRARSYSTKGLSAQPDDEVAALWAADRICEFSASSRPDAARIAQLARRYSLEGTTATTNGESD